MSRSRTDVGIGLLRVVEAVVRLGQALVVADYVFRAAFVERPTGGFQSRVSLPSVGQWKGLEAVGWGVDRVVLHCRTKETYPEFMQP